MLSGGAIGLLQDSAMYAVSGFVFNDANKNGVFDLTAEETKLGNRTVWADLNTDGVMDADEPSASTGATGSAYTLNLPAGDWLIRQLVPTGWQQTGRDASNNAGSFEASGVLSVPADLASPGPAPTFSFGSYPVPSIAGIVYNDKNFNGVKEAGEPESFGQQIYIDSNGNGLHDTTESISYSLGSSGYSFYGLAAGTYTLRLLPTSGYAQTDPASNGARTVTLSAGGSLTVNFGATNFGAVTGTLFNDLNGNNAQDVGDVGLAGRKVFLDVDGDLVWDAAEPFGLTNANGSYRVDGVSAGTPNNVAIEVLNGWKNVAPLAPFVTVQAGKVTTGANLFTTQLVPSDSVDPSYGTGGFFRSKTVAGNEAVALPNGQMLLAGYSAADFRGVLHRLNGNGTQDMNFGTGGKLLLPVQPGETFSFGPQHVAVAPDGKIVLAEGYPNGRRVLRLNADFSPDETFGSHGYVTVGFDGTEAYGFWMEGIAFGTDSSVIIGATAFSNAFTQGRMAIIKLTDTGAYDNTFTGDGRAIYTLGQSSKSELSEVAVQADGKLLLAGMRQEGINQLLNSYATLARVRLDGTLDPTYAGGTGYATYSFPGASPRRWEDVLIDSSGRAVVSGWNGSGAMLVGRFTTSGSPDGSFDGDGIALVPFVRPAGNGATTANGRFLMLGPGGDLVVVGNVDTTVNSITDIAAARLHADGSLDTTFGKGGRATTTLGYRNDEALGAMVNVDGSVVVAGYAHGPDEMVMVKFKPPLAQQAFHGSPYSVAAGFAVTIQAEDFDLGGEGIAYHDLESANLGGKYRTNEGVDLENASGVGSGANVGFARAGEWLEYSIDVKDSGSYGFAFNVSSTSEGGGFHAELDGVDVTGPVGMPNSGGWQTWKTVTKSGVSLSVGLHVLRLVMDANGASGYVGNFDAIAIAAGAAPPPVSQKPYLGVPFAINKNGGTMIEAENFDQGGEGVAYHDVEPANNGGQYRSDGVDIEKVNGDIGGYNVGWAAGGEWLEYSVDVADGGAYNIDFRVASTGSGGNFHLEMDGVNVTGTMTLPNTGGWQNWTTITKSGVNLAAGPHVLRLAMDSAGSTGAVGNFNNLKITPASAPPPSGQLPFGGTPVAINTGSVATIQVEDFDLGGEGVAFHDIESTNLGGKYRSSGVDLETVIGDSGGSNLAYTRAGEWLEYSVNVVTSGTYTFDFRVASAAAGGKWHVEMDGADVTGQLTMNNTGGWQSWTTVTKSGVGLTAGQHVMRLVMDADGTSGYVGNFNYIAVR